MSTNVTFFVEGTPRSKQRPRTVVNRTTKSGRVWTYNPTITSEYCDYVRVKAREYMKTRGLKPFPKGTPVTLLLKFYQRRVNTSRPDIINISANICDALNEVCYQDDAQITYLVVEKIKAIKKDKVGVRIGLIVSG